MLDKTKKVSASGIVILLLIFLNAVVVKVAFIRNSKWYMALIVTVPLLLFALYYTTQKKQKNRDLHITKSKKAGCSRFQYLN
jgi:L-asparagine transporter-like permease